MDWENDQRVLNDLLQRGIIRAPSSEVQAAFEDWKAQEAAKEIDSWTAIAYCLQGHNYYGLKEEWISELRDDNNQCKWISSVEYVNENLAYIAANNRRREMIEAALRKPKSLRAAVPQQACNSNR